MDVIFIYFKGKAGFRGKKRPIRRRKKNICTLNALNAQQKSFKYFFIDVEIAFSENHLNRP